MKVSIIIPVYNVEKYIERCLLSVLNQTWEDIEIILVNDCTPDNSIRIAQKLLSDYSGKKVSVFLEHEKNRGQSAARNTGIRVAEGGCIYFLDSDDYLPPDSISTLMAYYVKEECDFVIGNYEITGKSRSIPFLELQTGVLSSNEQILSSYAYDLWPRTVWNILINKSFLLKEQLFFEEGIIHEDDLWTFMLACKATKAHVINQITYYYYMHVHSTTGSPSLWNLQCRVTIITLLLKYISSSRTLIENRYAYIAFESAKAKYFDRILYFEKDESFRYASYLSFRKNKYIPPIQAVIKFKPGLILCLRNLHYLLPEKLGYLYFKGFVALSYKMLLLSIKISKYTGRKVN